jgi:hypothetical protein
MSAHHLPRASLPASGFASSGMVSRTMSERVTSPSSLLPAHAPDQSPPHASVSPSYIRYFAGCCEPLLGDGLSRRVGIGPLPRSVLLVLLLASSQKTTASPQTSQVRHTGLPLPCNFNRELILEAAVRQTHRPEPVEGQSFLYVQLPRSIDPRVAPTAEAQSLLGSRAVYTTYSSVGYLPRDVASLRIRHEQLIRWDSHQLDCSLVGCSDILKFQPFLQSDRFDFWADIYFPCHLAPLALLW